VRKGPGGKRPGAGRKLGSRNKITIAFKEATMRAFNSIGGDAAFAKWAKKNQTEFYKIAARLIPTEMNVSGTAPATIQIVQFTDGPILFATRQEALRVQPQITHEHADTPRK